MQVLVELPAKACIVGKPGDKHVVLLNCRRVLKHEKATGARPDRLNGPHGFRLCENARLSAIQPEGTEKSALLWQRSGRRKAELDNPNFTGTLTDEDLKLASPAAVIRMLNSGQLYRDLDGPPPSRR